MLHAPRYHTRPGANTLESWSLLVSIIFIVVFCAVAWFASPKGENQTYVSPLFLSGLLRARLRDFTNDRTDCAHLLTVRRS